MGVVGLWSVLEKKKFEPGIAIADYSKLKVTYHLDLFACLFVQIRSAFCTYEDTEKAHEAIQRALLRLFPGLNNITIYLDGRQALEERATHLKRLKIAKDALLKARESYSSIEKHIGSRQDKWPSKQKEGLSKDNDFDLRGQAGVATIPSFQGLEGDIIVSGDSDMLIYPTVETVWRPISRGRFLVYNLFEVGKYLEIGRSGLTVLGIVSNNDYSKNIFGLGAISNLAVIRDIPWSCKDECHV
ncbi:hypothetical protein BC939DRAFT_473129 [Gamsiella multidivaricata]|uniref:uncharacterized protein n=1 Tax=Gamsiella multidivaricata TaxID=101098 RepID=UPI00221E4493|nr:uncharacterized protein BC939DRAFT_473129 [Gamsiella multidivaricata]KAI7831572.1 hypothetical protein BC939DRAFT_473129 [Gamsiella multidivaricata]